MHQEPQVDEKLLTVPELPLIHDEFEVAAVLFGVLAALFAFNKTGLGKRVFAVAPLLLWCYFVPTALSNLGLIPSKTGKHSSLSGPVLRNGETNELVSFELYSLVTGFLLPASLLLLILSVDLPGILKLGRNAVILFLVAVATITLGGPLAYLAWGWMVNPESAEVAWRGMAALSGSWIGGGANMVAIQQSVGAGYEEALKSFIGVVIVVDVAVANVWMAGLLWFAARNKEMDARIQADRDSLDAVQAKAEQIELESSRPTDLGSLLAMAGIAFLVTVISHRLGVWFDGVVTPKLPDGSTDIARKTPFISDMASPFTWKILIVTGIGILLSFTKARQLEGAGASKVGGTFLYFLVAVIGAGANFKKIADPENLPFLLIGFTWMAFHAGSMLYVRWKLRAPIFFAAVGSKACVGGAASAPIVAAAFNPVLAPVGVLLAIGGYIFGTIAGLGCAALLKLVNGLYHG